MKYLTILCLLCTALSFAQNGTTIKISRDGTATSELPRPLKSLDCNQSKIEASKLAASGQYVYVTAGNLDNSRTETELLIEKYLWEKHAIKTEVLSTCIPMGAEVCYMKAMNSKWKARFGEDFIYNKQIELKAEFEKHS
ncbi:hypothetical protein [Nonlabens antarcticus]|uniref:hypothetical protein n=1 Tax=Nonlabens antarcticus TaxID=392714 RepID=UPI001890E01D|nr:hypothetical protein [Nonlabens antarcticus]